MNRSDCLCTALRRAALSATALYDDALAPSGLKVTMYRLLKVAAGFEASEDERERVVALTARGRAALERAVPLWRAAQRDLERRLGGRGAELLALVGSLDPA